MYMQWTVWWQCDTSSRSFSTAVWPTFRARNCSFWEKSDILWLNFNDAASLRSVRCFFLPRTIESVFVFMLSSSPVTLHCSVKSNACCVLCNFLHETGVISSNGKIFWGKNKFSFFRYVTQCAFGNQQCEYYKVHSKLLGSDHFCYSFSRGSVNSEKASLTPWVGCMCSHLKDDITSLKFNN